LPSDLGETTENYLGRSQFAADAYYVGSLDEFRIYNRALSEGEVLYLAGNIYWVELKEYLPESYR
jgi:hypothetical protein